MWALCSVLQQNGYSSWSQCFIYIPTSPRFIRSSPTSALLHMCAPPKTTVGHRKSLRSCVPMYAEKTDVHPRDLSHVSSDFRAPSTSGTSNGPALFTNSTRGCLLSSVKGLAESLRTPRFSRSFRNPLVKMELFLTEPFFTVLLKTPLA